jgi:uncharacterized caspase-like protein
MLAMATQSMLFTSLWLVKAFVIIASLMSMGYAQPAKPLVSPVSTGNRIALVIGNDAYQNVTKLEKAGNDATAMARELRVAGFKVLEHRDLNYRGMVKAVEALVSSITGGDQVVVFFSGHGVQLKTGNYLLPTDIEAHSESEIEKMAYGLDDLTEKLNSAKPSFTLVMVDACRDNPTKGRGTKSIGGTRGLSPIEPPKGQMVIYSASKGQQALDRMDDADKNPNGVFTREFIARMKRPGVKIEELVREVQDAVEELAKSISHEQRPAIYNEARGNFYFYGPTTVQTAPQGGGASAAPVRVRTPEEIEDSFWDRIKDDREAVGFEEYLKQYPKGRYAGQARLAVSKLSAEAEKQKLQREKAEREKQEAGRLQREQTEARRLDEERKLGKAATNQVPTVVLRSDPVLQTSSDTVSLRLELRTASDAPISDVKVRVNGTLVRKLSWPRILDGILEIEVPLPNRDVEITVIAENRYGPADPTKIQVKRPDATTPRSAAQNKLYSLVVGISKYPEPFTLEFANKDARDFSQILSRRIGRNYSGTVPRLLIDEQATRQNILNGLKWLRESVTKNDAAVIFLVGHGDVLGSNYYFIPADTEALPAKGEVKTTADHSAWKAKNAMSRWIPDEEIGKTLFFLRGQVALFVDTSLSNWMVKYVERNRASALYANNDQNSMVVLGSTTGKELSQSDDAWGNGAFTKTLIEALNGTTGNERTDQLLPSSFATYVSDHVRALTQNEQRPTQYVIGRDEPMFTGK